MKRDWRVIVLIVGAIIAYQYFILRPLELKKLEENKKAFIEKKNSSVPVTIPTKQDETKETLLSDKIEFASFQEKETWTLSDDRELSVYPQGGVGPLKYLKYKNKDPNKNSQNVELLEDGFYLKSTHAEIQSCFNKMQFTQKSEKLWVAESKDASLACRWQLVADESNKEKFSIKLDLMGLTQEMAGSELLWSLKVPVYKKADLESSFLISKLDGEVNTKRDSKVLENDTSKQNFDWFAWGPKFFVSVFYPQGNYRPTYQSEAIADTGSDIKLRYPLVVNENFQYSQELGVYLGPRDVERISLLGVDFEKAADLGFFSFIAKWMIKALNLLNLIFHNYGFSIIALTIIVRALFWPLNKKVFESGNKMKLLQPEMEAIKKKYSSNKEQAMAMNMEIMALYKKHDVNPMGSCLPLLLQMPVFFGLYAAFNHSIDLYQAPFILWIQDLSFKDPYYVLPVLWSASLLLTMKYMPQQTQPGMPDMKWIMIAMYVFFGYASKDLPSGLTLYMLSSNLIGVIQQFLIRRESGQQQKAIS